MKKTTLSILLIVIIASLFIAGCTQPVTVQNTSQPTILQPMQNPTTQQPGDTVKVTSTSLGEILVDAEGKTLYYFANDIPASNVSSCNGQCATIWPVFAVDTVMVSSPLVSTDFTSFIRPDGKKQTTFRGWPLYYYQADTKPRDTNGDKLLNVWFVVKVDETVMVAHQGTVGTFLTDKMGKTLYFFTRDTSGTSTCTGPCLAKWPAFNGIPVSAPSVLKPEDFTTITRTDGVKQTAYMNRPLYYFADDAMPGEIRGEGFNTLWYVANISGALPVVTSPPTTVTATIPTEVPTILPTTFDYGGGY